MALSERRKFVLKRLAALIKNLETLPEQFTLDQQLNRELDKIENMYTHHKTRMAYREVQRDRKRLADEKREQIRAARDEEAVPPPIEEESDALQEEEAPEPEAEAKVTGGE